jgi:hypothetical protein
LNTNVEILEIDPDKRLSIAEILSHPWILSDLSLRNSSDTLVTFQHAKEGGEAEEGDILVPVDTTMLPYLKQLYLGEVESEISNCGLISDYIVHDEDSIGRVQFC